MTRPYTEKAEFLLYPSQGIANFLDIIHFISLLILATLSISFILKLLIIPFIYFHWKMNRCLHALRTHPQSVIRIWQETERRFGFETNALHRARGHLMGDSFKCPWFIIMVLRLNHRSKICIIPRDALPLFEYRMLCQRLLHTDCNKIRIYKNKK